MLGTLVRLVQFFSYIKAKGTFPLQNVPFF